MVNLYAGQPSGSPKISNSDPLTRGVHQYVSTYYVDITLHDFLYITSVC